MNLRDLELLNEAIDIAESARTHGNHPFGALLADKDGQILLRAENTVVSESDCTGHAETNLMRLASRQFSAAQLADCTLYTSTEPCAMCAGAIHWGGVGRVVYALSEIELYDIVGPSDEHLLLPCREVFARTQREIQVEGPVEPLRARARAVHEGFWRD